MRRSIQVAQWSALLALILMALCTLAGASDEAREVNAFYAKVKQAIKSPACPARALGELVAGNPGLAKKCLAAINQKAVGSSAEAVGLQLIANKLEQSLLLTSKTPDCSPEGVQRIIDLAESQTSSDDEIYVLECLIASCPRAWNGAHMLGDLYLKENQLGMAIGAYKKALAHSDDKNSRLLLARAEELSREYEKGKTITAEDVRKLMRLDVMERLTDVTMDPIPGFIARKAEFRPAIQTNQVLFDEWQSEIKGQFVPQLKELGRGLSEEFRNNSKVGILVEGHTDRRGDLDRNRKLSVDRAESIKRFLVREFHLDPSRIATKGYGPFKPFSPRDDQEGWALNRRVEFKRMDMTPDGRGALR